MRYTFRLYKEDYLHYALFTISRSPEFISLFRKQWFALAVAAVLFGWLDWRYLLAFGPLLILFPMYYRYHIRKSRVKKVAQIYADVEGLESTVEFDGDQIRMSDENGSDGSVPLSSVREGTITPSHFLFSVVGGQTMILPLAKIDQDAIRDHLRQHNIPVNYEPDWSWRSFSPGLGF